MILNSRSCAGLLNICSAKIIRNIELRYASESLCPSHLKRSSYLKIHEIFINWQEIKHFPNYCVTPTVVWKWLSLLDHILTYSTIYFILLGKRKKINTWPSRTSMCVKLINQRCKWNKDTGSHKKGAVMGNGNMAIWKLKMRGGGLV